MPNSSNEKNFKSKKSLLTVKQVAEWLSVTEKTILKWVKNGDIPFIRIGSGRGVIRFQKQEILKYYGTI